MNRIDVLPIGEVERGLLERLAPALAREFEADCRLLPVALDPRFAFHAERQQHHSTELLAGMRPQLANGAWRLLGVAEVDLYIPILTFVFGEAQMNGPCALLSTHRLRQELYGLPPDHELLFQRLLKEAVHELGHTVGLTHCDDHECAMAASHAVEWIDLKGPGLCSLCHNQVFANNRKTVPAV